MADSVTTSMIHPPLKRLKLDRLASCTSINSSNRCNSSIPHIMKENSGAIPLQEVSSSSDSGQEVSSSSQELALSIDMDCTNIDSTVRTTIPSHSNAGSQQGNGHESEIPDSSLGSTDLLGDSSENLFPSSTDKEENEDDLNSTISELSGLGDFSDLSGDEWKSQPSVVQILQKQLGHADPRVILSEFIPANSSAAEIFSLDDATLWRFVSVFRSPPPRTRLPHVSSLDHVVNLLNTCKKIVVLTGAGVSVSCGIPDFRSPNGIYSRLRHDYPDLPDPQAMFDIHYFNKDPRPFFKFAREIYPGQFEPSISHKFIKLLEDRNQLLRNYSQNIDTLEHQSGISKVITCHGSFKTASCLKCHHKVDASAIKEKIFNQEIPFCSICTDAEVNNAIMKPDIVFFGEGLPEEFHTAMAEDKTVCDLLIVMGSSLKVRPVALLPSYLPASTPQVLINREPLRHMCFDIELLGDCDVIISDLCARLGEGWSHLRIQNGTYPLKEITSLPNYESSEPSAVDSTTADSPSHKMRESLAMHLPKDSYLSLPPNRYVFPGAVVFVHKNTQSAVASCSYNLGNSSDDDSYSTDSDSDEQSDTNNEALLTDTLPMADEDSNLNSVDGLEDADSGYSASKSSESS